MRIEKISHIIPKQNNEQKNGCSTLHNINPTTLQMENNTLAELVGLLSQAIDIIRNHGAEDDANYIETEMENTIQHYTGKSK